MKAINLEKRIIGVNFDENGQAEIVLWAPNASTAYILINEKEKLPLLEEAYGYWQLFTDKLKEGDLYQFIIDDKKPLPDPASLSQPKGVHGPSQTIDLNKIRKEGKWDYPELEEYIIYELHTGTFTPEGTFAGIESKLKYLKDLGVNAIEIMPVAQFPGERNWGYDGVLPFAVQHSYGGAEGLRHLVDACHQHGIAVVLDVVYNHVGPEGNYLGEFGEYFTDKYHTPWGNAVNFDDAWSDGVRQFVIENVLMWFRDFNIDALRMDAVHAIKDLGPNHILREIKEHVNALMKQTGRQHYLIVECDLNDTKFIDPLEEQGYGMDAQWIDEFHHSLRVASGNERNGYYADFDGIVHLAKSYKDAYVYDGIYSEHRKKVFGNKADDNPGKQFIIFSQNHDQVGNRMLGERTSQLVSYEMQKLMAGAVLLSPYIPMLFMGEEWSAPNPFQYFVSHTDPELVEAVRKGRKAEFSAFHAQGEAPDPQSEETFQNSKLDWELIDKPQHRKMLEYYKRLIELRKTHPALVHLDRDKVNVSVNKDSETLVLHRWYNEHHLICLMNFSKKEQNITVPTVQKQLTKILSSSDNEWGGHSAAAHNINNEQAISLQPESLLIYTN
jgi:maltooligosyltrehalose trehalohydrolase